MSKALQRIGDVTDDDLSLTQPEMDSLCCTTVHTSAVEEELSQQLIEENHSSTIVGNSGDNTNSKVAVGETKEHSGTVCNVYSTINSIRLPAVRGRGRPPTRGGRTHNRGSHGRSCHGGDRSGRIPDEVMNDSSNQEKGLNISSWKMMR
jgi:hypothetical protein